MALSAPSATWHTKEGPPDDPDLAYHAEHSDRQVVGGFLVPLTFLRVSIGAACGDRLECSDDLLVGDIVRLVRGGTCRPVLIQCLGHKKLRILDESLDIGSAVATATRLKSITLMTEVGCAIYAQVLSFQNRPDGSVVLLLDEELTANTDFALIAEHG